jgi:hypothetical protein
LVKLFFLMALTMQMASPIMSMHLRMLQEACGENEKTENHS